MAFVTYRTSRGRKYWSIVESRRINGKPKQVILEYLGTAETLLQRLQDKRRISLKSYSHGDTSALITVAKELDLINVINRHIPSGKNGNRPVRDGLTVGSSFLLAAIGRACHPTSKMGWYEWCKTTSLEYCLKTSFKNLDSQHLRKRLAKIIKGQFIEDILKYDLFELEDKAVSFTYYVDSEAFEQLKKEVLGRKILVTSRHGWSSEEIISAYRGQAKVEYAFRNLKNPYHLSVRPQYHWTDQKIKAHIFICVIGYLLAIAAYTKAREKAGYRKNLSSFIEDLSSIRLACSRKSKSNIVNYQLESIPRDLRKVAKLFGITDDNIRTELNLSVYN